mgnify:CR=1 FL=1
MSESFAALFEESLKRSEMRTGEVITAEVVRVEHNHVVVNAGLKSEAYVPIEEFKNDQGDIEVQAGDFVGASATKRADGKMVAEAIHYLDFIPAANRDAAHGDIPWDLTPQSLMINADSGTVVKASDGTMTLDSAGTKAPASKW